MQQLTQTSQVVPLLCCMALVSSWQVVIDSAVGCAGGKWGRISSFTENKSLFSVAWPSLPSSVQTSRSSQSLTSSASCVLLYSLFCSANNTVILSNIITISNSCFLWEYIVKCNLFLWSKLNFQHYYSSLQCHMILQKSFKYETLEHKRVISNTGIFVAIANNTLYGSKSFLLCQKSLGY